MEGEIIDNFSRIIDFIFYFWRGLLVYKRALFHECWDRVGVRSQSSGLRRKNLRSDFSVSRQPKIPSIHDLPRTKTLYFFQTITGNYHD